jgi:hypothetical protein
VIAGGDGHLFISADGFFARQVDVATAHTDRIRDLYPCGNERFPESVQRRLARIARLLARRAHRPASASLALHEESRVERDAGRIFARGRLSVACAGEVVAMARDLTAELRPAGTASPLYPR